LLPGGRTRSIVGMRQPVEDAERFDDQDDLMLAEAAAAEADPEGSERDPPADDDYYVPV
jgi:hypothetical protein